ncbi:unnamed protein product [Ilex paraguariensis]|uniref:PsbP C-terminal domain-containing protein n=1 Tax=Ilex paraguariensis TaxID=185542 RepID=A0ABC8UH07_9AQUA
MAMAMAAPVSSLSSQFYCRSVLLPHVSDLFTAQSRSHFHQRGFNKNRNLNVFCCQNNAIAQNPCLSTEDHSQTRRREILFHTVFTAISLHANFSVASPENDLQEDFRMYSDDVNKFKIMIPRDWQVGAGDGNGIKSVTAFYPEETSNSNVSIIITGLGADFTRLESFGKVDSFAETLVSGLDRSWRRPPGVAAKLIDSKATNGLYYVEYTLQNPGESRRFLFSVLGIANNGWYNRLYTVTGQFVEEEAEKYGSKIEKVVASFRLL